jgi:hypothetical protein
MSASGVMILSDVARLTNIEALVGLRAAASALWGRQEEAFSNGNALAPKKSVEAKKK